TADWWVGNIRMLPFVVLAGILIVRKTRRSTMVLTFLAVSLLTTVVLTLLGRSSVPATLEQTLFSSPLVFFAAVILTEPLTTPPTRSLQIIYGALVGFLISPQFHVGSFYTTPELSILVGNVFSYIVSPKAKLLLRLKDKVQIAPDIYDFVFTPSPRLAFAPGQYMEWTLGHDHADSRGNRRYFTLASSPTERDLVLGVRFYPNSSSYKQAMLAMDQDTEIVAAQLAGDFVLPRSPRIRLVFIAGGIGITPFRSMIQYLLDTRQKRPITLFYANRTVSEIVYKDVFDRAQRELGIKTIYTLTDASKVPLAWKGRVGYITPQIIKAEVPHFADCFYYLSGPNAMVTSFEQALRRLRVSKSHIKTDFFPGFA
ncbi:MAG TPA: RnfABCDGE type electron transport complex subunit D, partial [Aggregatilineales bacterium]|nr:RnfABCDGE type electron transport complex subunit D [Aggregatilineales bacterium]